MQCKRGLRNKTSAETFIIVHLLGIIIYGNRYVNFAALHFLLATSVLIYQTSCKDIPDRQKYLAIKHTFHEFSWTKSSFAKDAVASPRPRTLTRIPHTSFTTKPPPQVFAPRCDVRYVPSHTIVTFRSLETITVIPSDGASLI